MRFIRAAAILFAAAATASAQTAVQDDPTAWKIPVSFEDDVDKGVFAAWQERMEAANQLLFTLTEGQFRFAEVSLEDKSGRGRLVIPEGHADREILEGVEAMGLATQNGTPFWKIRISGRPDGFPGRTWSLGTVVVHELGHAVFAQLDERDSTQPGWECPDCIMGTDPTKLCGKDTHRGTAPTKSCKELIADRFPQVAFPNPKWKAGTKAPKPRFTITDRGPRDVPPEFAPFTPEEEKLVKEMAAKGRALTVTVAFEGNVSRRELKDWQTKMAEFDAMIRAFTAEQFFIATAVIEDRRDKADIVIEKGCEGPEATVLKSNRNTMLEKTSKGWKVVGSFPSQNFARYVLPDWLKIQEASADCAECFFNTGVWDERTKLRICGDDHKGGGTSCQEQLAAAWRAADVVNPAKIKPGGRPMPATRFRIVDR